MLTKQGPPLVVPERGALMLTKPGPPFVTKRCAVMLTKGGPPLVVPERGALGLTKPGPPLVTMRGAVMLTKPGPQLVTMRCALGLNKPGPPLVTMRGAVMLTKPGPQLVTMRGALGLTKRGPPLVTKRCALGLTKRGPPLVTKRCAVMLTKPGPPFVTKRCALGLTKRGPPLVEFLRVETVTRAVDMLDVQLLRPFITSRLPELKKSGWGLKVAASFTDEGVGQLLRAFVWLTLDKEEDLSEEVQRELCTAKKSFYQVAWRIGHVTERSVAAVSAALHGTPPTFHPPKADGTDGISKAMDTVDPSTSTGESDQLERDSGPVNVSLEASTSGDIWARISAPAAEANGDKKTEVEEEEEDSEFYDAATALARASSTASNASGGYFSPGAKAGTSPQACAAIWFGAIAGDYFGACGYFSPGAESAIVLLQLKAMSLPAEQMATLHDLLRAALEADAKKEVRAAALKNFFLAIPARCEGGYFSPGAQAGASPQTRVGLTLGQWGSGGAMDADEGGVTPGEWGSGGAMDADEGGVTPGQWGSGGDMDADEGGVTPGQWGSGVAMHADEGGVTLGQWGSGGAMDAEEGEMSETPEPAPLPRSPIPAPDEAPSFAEAVDSCIRDTVRVASEVTQVAFLLERWSAVCVEVDERLAHLEATSADLVQTIYPKVKAVEGVPSKRAFKWGAVRPHQGHLLTEEVKALLISHQAVHALQQDELFQLLRAVFEVGEGRLFSVLSPIAQRAVGATLAVDLPGHLGDLIWSMYLPLADCYQQVKSVRVTAASVGAAGGKSLHDSSTARAERVIIEEMGSRLHHALRYRDPAIRMQEEEIFLTSKLLEMLAILVPDGIGQEVHKLLGDYQGWLPAAVPQWSIAPLIRLVQWGVQNRLERDPIQPVQAYLQYYLSPLWINGSISDMIIATMEPEWLEDPEFQANEAERQAVLRRLQDHAAHTATTASAASPPPSAEAPSPDAAPNAGPRGEASSAAGPSAPDAAPSSTNAEYFKVSSELVHLERIRCRWLISRFVTEAIGGEAAAVRVKVLSIVLSFHQVLQYPLVLKHIFFNVLDEFMFVWLEAGTQTGLIDCVLKAKASPHPSKPGPNLSAAPSNALSEPEEGFPLIEVPDLSVRGPSLLSYLSEDLQNRLATSLLTIFSEASGEITSWRQVAVGSAAWVAERVANKRWVFQTAIQGPLGQLLGDWLHL
eukprot:gene1285-1870_t